MRILQHEDGEQFTITMEATAMGKPITGTMHGRFRSAIIDGLLWWTLNRKLDALVAACMPLPSHVDMSHAQALHIGEALVAYVHTADYHGADEDRARVIVRTIHNRLPELLPLCTAMVARETEHGELVALANIIRDRIAFPNVAEHGIEALLVKDAKKAA